MGPGVTSIQTCCQERLPEIEFGLRRGTTTNSYLLKGSGNSFEALVDVPSKAFDADMVATLKGLGALDSLKHIIITRLTPERIDTLAKVVAACAAPPEVLMTNPALRLLEDKSGGKEAVAKLLNGAKLTVVNRGMEVVLSGGKELRFIPVPTPRWPDLVAVYSPSSKLLFSSNLFSAHAVPDEAGGGWDDGGWGKYGDDWRHYYECMLAPVARQAAAALDRLNLCVGTPLPSGGNRLSGLFSALAGALYDLTLGADDGAAQPLEVATLCPMHGPLVRGGLSELLSRYIEWTEAQVKASSEGFVAVMYASAYGNTASLAQAISHGITKSGVGVETINLEQVSVEEVEKVLEKAAGFVLGSPTLGGHLPTPVQTALGAIMRSSATKRLPCGVYGSFGWSGEAVDIMEAKLKDAGYKLSFDSIRCKFKPTQQTLQQCEESGTDLAQAVKKNRKKQEKATAGNVSVAESASSKAQALGRVVGTLCVLTARDGDARSGMLASWVSQASFDPPGFTVAVKKDRAVESMLVTGCGFVLNVLGEGKEKGAMKSMLRPFKPGQDRFEGVEVMESEATGAPILPDAAAYLECKVASRMEAGDHWVVYATVTDGKVLDEGTPSAVHFRKVATNY